MVTRGRGSVSSACLQPSVHDAAPPSLHGVREGPFPRFVATMGRCDSLPSISPRFVAFAWRYHRCVPRSSPPAQDTGLWINLEIGKPEFQPAACDGDGKVSQVPVKPVRSFAMFSDPGETRQAEWTTG
jgi:hypothetical protein